MKNNDLKQNTQQPGRANKVAQKGKKNRKRKAGKRVATITDSNSRRESEEEESEISEDSPRKEDPPQRHNSRSVRLNLFQPASAVRSLNEQLSSLNEEEKKDLKVRGRINRVNIAKQNEDEAIISSTAYSKMIGGKCTHTECVMDSGCSFPLTSTAITKALGIEAKQLKEKLEMLDG